MSQNRNLACVDRSNNPVYPDKMVGLLHPELERTGPAEYEVGALILGYVGWQRNDVLILGHKLYDSLVSGSLLGACLGLSDLIAIQALGIEVFRRHFSGMQVFGWKSVADFQDGHRRVPYLFEHCGEVKIGWYLLARQFGVNDPALRFA